MERPLGHLILQWTLFSKLILKYIEGKKKLNSIFFLLEKFFFSLEYHFDSPVRWQRHLAVKFWTSIYRKGQFQGRSYLVGGS